VPGAALIPLLVLVLIVASDVWVFEDARAFASRGEVP
jgi:hypothetical protein